jgi:hypothetical protein
MVLSASINREGFTVCCEQRIGKRLSNVNAIRVNSDQPPELAISFRVDFLSQSLYKTLETGRTSLKEGLMAQNIEYAKNYQNIKAKISDGSLITGKINIMNFSRLSEYLKQSTDKFITILSEETEGAGKKTTIVNKDHIIWADTWD